MDQGFDDLESSLSLDDSLLAQGGSIDNLYHTYLGNMDAYSPGQEGSGQVDAYATAGYGDYEVKSFQSLSVADWRGEECLEWAESVCRRCGVDRSTIDLWSLSSTPGTSLLQFTGQDFCQVLGHQHGHLFHRELQALIKRKARGNKKKSSRLHEEASNAMFLTAASSPTSSYDPDTWDFTTEDLKDLDQYIPDESWEPLVDNLQGLDLHEEFVPIKYEPEEPPCQYPTASAPAAISDGALALPADAVAHNADVFKKIPTNTRRRERGPKSWEFLIRLLADKQTNPALIRWEDEASATFRLMQPAIIAKMWGARSEKSNLTYVNFARGLRYHYNTGALMAVSERQLVYRCGPKALKYLKELQGSS